MTTAADTLPQRRTRRFSVRYWAEATDVDSQSPDICSGTAGICREAKFSPNRGNPEDRLASNQEGLRVEREVTERNGKKLMAPKEPGSRCNQYLNACSYFGSLVRPAGPGQLAKFL